jgi:hypothetical protein
MLYPVAKKNLLEIICPNLTLFQIGLNKDMLYAYFPFPPLDDDADFPLQL